MKKIFTCLMSLILVCVILTSCADTSKEEMERLSQIISNTLDDYQSIDMISTGMLDNEIIIKNRIKVKSDEDNVKAHFDLEFFLGGNNTTGNIYIVNDYAYVTNGETSSITKEQPNYAFELAKVDVYFNLYFDALKTMNVKLNRKKTKTEEMYTIIIENFEFNESLLNDESYETGNLEFIIVVDRDSNLLKMMKYTVETISDDILTNMSFKIEIISVNEEVEIEIPNNILDDILKFKNSYIKTGGKK